MTFPLCADLHSPEPWWPHGKGSADRSESWWQTWSQPLPQKSCRGQPAAGSSPGCPPSPLCSHSRWPWSPWRGWPSLETPRSPAWRWGWSPGSPRRAAGASGRLRTRGPRSPQTWGPPRRRPNPEGCIRYIWTRSSSRVGKDTNRMEWKTPHWLLGETWTARCPPLRVSSWWRNGHWVESTGGLPHLRAEQELELATTAGGSCCQDYPELVFCGHPEASPFRRSSVTKAGRRARSGHVSEADGPAWARNAAMVEASLLNTESTCGGSGKRLA